jgi:hypothetical protein
MTRKITRISKVIPGLPRQSFVTAKPQGFAGDVNFCVGFGRCPIHSRRFCDISDDIQQDIAFALSSGTLRRRCDFTGLACCSYPIIAFLFSGCIVGGGGMLGIQTTPFHTCETAMSPRATLEFRKMQFCNFPTGKFRKIRKHRIFIQMS